MQRLGGLLRRHLGILLLVLVPVTPSLAEDFIRLGSWNIQNLGERDFGQHQKALAQHLFLANVDLFALQEIHDTDDKATTRTNATLDAVVDLLNERDGHRWRYVLFPGRTVHSTIRLTGIAWNGERLIKVGQPYKVAVDYQGSDEVWKRHPYAVKFSAGPGKTDIVVVPLHMKSNFNGETLGRQTREREARALSEKLEAIRLHFADRDLVLTGDTNCLRADEPALNIYAASGLVDLNATDQPTYKDNRAPFDRILVPSGQNEFRFSRQYVLTPADPNQHFGRLSDHYLVLTAIRILADDD